MVSGYLFFPSILIFTIFLVCPFANDEIDEFYFYLNGSAVRLLT